IESLNPDVRFLNSAANMGIVSDSEVQITYIKINGTQIVDSLSALNPTMHVPLGNSYFSTNPHFDKSWTTAVWVKVNATAKRGDVVKFQVGLIPSNGPTETLIFETMVN
ncbi:MAG: hypothetical protein AABZ06_08280, partial [Bdellovibrionota bacterium]